MRTLVIAAAAALLFSGCSNDEEGPGGAASPYALPQSDEPVELDPADFVRTIDNMYWPMAPGSRWVYREVDADGSRQHVEVTVTNQTKTILGITATVVHDRVTADGELVEDTDDWYAQDRWAGSGTSARTRPSSRTANS
jgi:hypothetical protein